MFKKRIIAPGIALFLLIVAISATSVLSQKGAFLSTKSSNGTYQVLLTGSLDRPKVLLLDHSVELKAIKSGQPLLDSLEVHTGDWLDPSFNELFPQSRWVTDNALQFYHPMHHSNSDDTCSR
jgi:hypothetical protein